MNLQLKARPVTRPFPPLSVADVMHPGIVSCPREAPLSTVARMMARYRIHCVITNAHDGAWGVVSDRDVAAAVAAGRARTTSAGAAAATETVTIHPEEPLARAAQLMHEHDVSHLVVVHDGTPTGIISTLDVATALAGM